MKALISKSEICGNLTAPASKSLTHRSLIMQFLSGSKSGIKNKLICKDTIITENALRVLQLGTKGKKTNGPLYIWCADSGTSARLLTAVTAVSDKDVILDGHEKLRQRPMQEEIEALNKLGISVKCLKIENHLPIRIQGRAFLGGELSIDIEKSSQFASALLIISPLAQQSVKIAVSGNHSLPYLEMTVRLMRIFGIKIVQKGNTYEISGRQTYRSSDYTVEGDYSSSSYPLAAALLAGKELTINGLSKNSLQGDSILPDLLTKIGSRLFWENKTLKLVPGKIKAFELNLGNFPDLVPTFAVLATKADNKCLIKNIGHLKHKESDRISAIRHNLSKMGIKTEYRKEILSVFPGQLKGNAIEDFNDHRIIMAFTVAGLEAEGITTIHRAQAVDKSYPDFYKDLKKIGAQISLVS